ncbi:MAG TPA: zf-HC2 domain-containing protein [Kofleriaceae bacterium]|jgi:hypothetical protein|nr:zf-HC2 domain-containing protein [Kofleriaceae bacterium]
MTERCADLDEFFDGELEADQADAFRDHLADCERCQRVLHGRMQESVAVRVPGPHPVQAPAPSAVAPAVPMVAAMGSASRPAPAVEPAAVVPIARARSRCVRTLAYLTPLVAAAAAVPIWLLAREPGFELALTFDRAPVTERGGAAAVPRRGLAAHTGDVVRPEVHGEPHLALWVYLDEHELIVRCPEDAQCRSAGGELALELPLTTRGKYTIVALGSSEAIPAPGATLDTTLAAARTAGVRTQVKSVDVD